MKYIYIRIVFGMTLILMAACTDLEVKPQSVSSADDLLSNLAGYEGFFAKVYGGLQLGGQIGPSGDSDIRGTDENESQYIRILWNMQQLATDETVIGWGDRTILDFHSHAWGSSDVFIGQLYDRIFFQITMANEFLRQSDDDILASKTSLSTSDIETIGGWKNEVRFLRALSYMHALDLFGDIPFFTELDAIGLETPDQVTRAQVFEFVENELADIESLLPAVGSQEYGRADQGAVWAVQAKLFLNAEVFSGVARYEDCVTACEKIINSAYTLDPVYQNLFLADNHNSPEMIFAVPFDGVRTKTDGGMSFLIHASVGGNMDAAASGIEGGWWGLRTTSAVVDRFTDITGNTDSRAIFFTDGHTKEITNIGDFFSGYPVPKFKNIKSDGGMGALLQYPDTDFPMFRLAGIYLDYAEATLRGATNGSRSTALQLINDLRDRAYGDTSGNIADAALTLDFILDERSRELLWEGHRRTDLVRFNQFTENGIWPWKGGVPEGRTTESYRNVYPIPSIELANNPKLSPTDGYGGTN